MTTEEIEAFLAICEAKSISKAAEKLYISQPSLSTKLKTLEQETGCTLLARRKGQRELSLTEAGRRFYDLAVQYRRSSGRCGRWEARRRWKSCGYLL